MTKQYSVADARNNLPGIVHEVETGCAIEITRRGRPVAVLVSVTEYERLTAPKGTFWDAVQAWRKTVDWDEMGNLADVFKDVRDPSPGRDFQW